MATFLLVIKTSKKNVILKKILYIYYPLCFQKNIIDIKLLIDSGNKVNDIILGFALKLDFKVYFTNIKAQKIDNFTLKIFKIVLANF